MKKLFERTVFHLYLTRLPSEAWALRPEHCFHLLFYLPESWLELLLCGFEAGACSHSLFAPLIFRPFVKLSRSEGNGVSSCRNRTGVCYMKRIVIKNPLMIIRNQNEGVVPSEKACYCLSGGGSSGEVMLR